jgi:GT2 family glycosyltransferase
MNVVALVATFRRSSEISRLFTALEFSSVPLHGVVVVDNAGDDATRAAALRSRLPMRVLTPGENLGCGGGLRLAEETALREFPALTHVWILDDDTVPEAATLVALLDAMRGCGAACPIVHDADGKLNWFPGLRDRAVFNVLRRCGTPDEYVARCGLRAEPFTWAPGVALLVARAALHAAGFHRADFWVRGEDLDFSLRVTAASGGVFVPAARLAHLPPGGGRVVDDFAERMKHAAMLQNCACLSRSRHGRVLLKHWPGNAWRHVRRFGIQAIRDVLVAAGLGGIRGLPAGAPGGDSFRRRLAAG